MVTRRRKNNPFLPRGTYKIYLYNMVTGEEQHVCFYGRDFLTKREADNKIASIGSPAAPWVYRKRKLN